jgi:hypothetical protein
MERYRAAFTCGNLGVTTRELLREIRLRGCRAREHPVADRRRPQDPRDRRARRLARGVRAARQPAAAS